MTPERWRRVEELFHDARERAPEDQQAFLDAACGSDSDLQRDVASLLDHSEPAMFRDGVHAIAAAVVPPPSRTEHQGRQLGPYLLGPLIGAGGMGDVYRAHDAKLGRYVAVKILPAALADHPDRLARSEREARILAALNHPNIAAIYGIAEGDGIRGLVLELVEGVTLKERLDDRPSLSLDEALSIARQIAAALEAAHQKGIVHRDLKPGNVKITPAGVVKVLDFGLAKIEQREGSSPAALSVLATSDGVVLGTVAYMSPEQARGLAVDKRADIWAFGCVLYEMLAGVRAFAGESAADVLGRITGQQPDWDRLPGTVPPRVLYVLQRCLTKDPSRRYHDIADARIDLDEGEGLPLEAAGAGKRRSTARAPWWLAAALAAIAAYSLWVVPSSRTAVDPTPVRVAIPLPSDVALFNIGRGSSVAVSPDGQRVAFVGVANGRRRLYLRSLTAPDSMPLAGTENASTPVFSPNGRWIAFVNNTPSGQLLKVPEDGGPVLPVVELPFDGGGGFAVQAATWTADGEIVFAALNPRSRGIWRVSADGGTAARLTTPGEDALFDTWPQVIASGQALLYTTWNNTGFEGGRIVVRRLTAASDPARQVGEPRVLVRGASYARVVTAENGRAWLIYARPEGLQAAPFDLERLEVSGAAMPVVDQVAVNMSGGAHYSVSDNGLLAYVPGRLDEPNKTAVWVARDGSGSEIRTIEGLGFEYRLSPDGRRLARPNAAGPLRDLWIDDLEARRTPTRLTEGETVHNPVWTPDGARVIYAAGRPVSNLYWRAADGSGIAERLMTSTRQSIPWSVTPDGRMLVYSETHESHGDDLWLLPLAPRGEPRPLLATRFAETYAAVSPDGRWVAYQSSRSGRFDVYVTSLAGGGPQIPVSVGGGTAPLWSRDGRELYFRATTGASGSDMMVVSITARGHALRASAPRVLFSTRYQGNADIAPDGRFLLVLPTPEASPSRVIQLIMNWFEELQVKAPQ